MEKTVESKGDCYVYCCWNCLEDTSKKDQKNWKYTRISRNR